MNLLGLVIHLDRVVLTINGQTGPGDLLGNPSCAITGLLNGVNLGSLGATLVAVLTTLRNQPLAILAAL